MKKLMLLLLILAGLAGFFYFYYSAPKVLERRLDSLLATMNFGTITLKDTDKIADKFTSHFAEEVTFSGSGNDIITGTVSPQDLRDLYLNQFRAAAKNARAQTSGDTVVKLKATDRAEMDTTIQLDIVLRNNTSYPQTIPTRMIWRKVEGDWVIAEIQLQEAVNSVSF